MDRAILEKSGICYAGGLTRFMEDGALYEEMLTAFLSDNSFSEALKAFASRDYAALFERAHMLKGIAGNLEMTALCRAADELGELIRHDTAPDKLAVAAAFDRLQSAYHQVASGIQAASRQREE